MPNGLRGVFVAESSLSYLDGERGELFIRGHDIRALVEGVGFEEVCCLLWTGRLPEPRALRCLRRDLGAARVRAAEDMWLFSVALDAEDPVDALQAALACLPASERRGDTGRDGKLRIVAALAVVAAAWWRRSQGQPLVAPDPALPHCEDWLRMLGIDSMRAARVRALDAWMVALAEHGTNASAFAARVVASTRADSVSAVLAGLAALKGTLHGGITRRVHSMLDAIGDTGNAAAWLERELESGRRLPGFGHPIYRARDPRAAALESAAAQLSAAGEPTRYLALARAVEREALRLLGERYPGRRIAANVDLYGAALLDAVGLPPELFIAAFAATRAAGWLAHVEEQRASGSLLRPEHRYVGQAPLRRLTA